MNCEICDKNIGTDLRWVLADETQMCIWTGPDEMPEIDFREVVLIGYYCCEQHADEACNKYLTLAGAKATWADVRPTEVCSICEADFNTNSWHRVLTLSQERGDEDNPEIVDVEYVARFCPQCIPCD